MNNKTVLCLIIFLTLYSSQLKSQSRGELPSPSPDTVVHSGRTIKHFVNDEPDYYTPMSPGILLGYFADIPNAYLGFSAAILNSEFGLFFSFSTSTKSFDDKNYYDNISVSTARGWHDGQTGKDLNAGLYVVGAYFNIYRNIFGYGGIGYVSREHYLQFYDEFHILGDNGSYWVKESSEENYCLCGGFMLVIDNVFLQLGTGTMSPGSVQFGIGGKF
jgi:hypothetical protein